jgi:RNA-directed DNA polymerase
MEAYRLTRKDGASGIDGVTAADYEVTLEANLLDLLDRIKSGRYRAPPVRRAYIPKADGSQRMLGIPTFEDKVAQRAVTMVLEDIYEQDFLPCSYGFRPGRSAHQALRALQNVLWAKRLYWVLDIDIRKYFDSIPHSHLRTFLDQRVTDGVIRRMIDKWLKAGAVEDGLLRHTTEGSPQGGVISPCLSNIFLHYVLDEWFETEVKPRLRGECTLVRYADGVRQHRRRQARAVGPGQASRTVWTHPPPRQDAPRRLPPKEVTGCAPSGDGWDHLRLPGPDPCLGTVSERQGDGSASDGQGPICSRGGRG